METICFKLEDSIAKEMEKAMKPMYTTKTEFIREAIRDKISKMEKDAVIKDLLKLKGSVKSHTSDAEMRRIREEVSEEYMRNHDLK